MSATNDLRPDEQAAGLPSEIDVVGLATGGSVAGLRVLYRVSSGCVWERVE